MFKLDNNFLTSLGLGSLPVDEKNKLLQHIYERLEMNVGMRLAEKMTDAQLDEFEGFIDRNDESGALRWLETNFPNYKDVVAEELEKLKTEVQQAAPHILAAAQNNAQPAPAQQMPPQQPQNFATPPADQYMAQPSPQMDPYQQPAPSQPQPSYQPQADPGLAPQQPAYGPAPQAPQEPGFGPAPQAPTDPYQAPQQPDPYAAPQNQQSTDQNQQPPAGFPPAQQF